jgi:hypothetical protein
MYHEIICNILSYLGICLFFPSMDLSEEEMPTCVPERAKYLRMRQKLTKG